MITVEDGITMPRPTGGPGAYRRTEARGVIDDLAVGQSFMLPYQSPADYRTARNLAYNAGQKTGRKFSTRVIVGGIRIWRTA